MHIRFTVDGADVAVDAEAVTPVAAVVASVLPTAGGQRVHADGRALDPRIALGASGLRDGSRLGVGPPARVSRRYGPVNPPTGTPVVAVVGGPDAGLVLPLDRGVVLGRNPPFGLTDRDVSRQHLQLTPRPDGSVEAVDLGSRNGTFLEGSPVLAATTVPPGSVLWLGDTAVTVRTVPLPDAALRPDGEGGLVHNRPPRLDTPRAPVRLAVPIEPTAPARREWPVVMVVAPIVLGGVMAFFLGPQLLLMGLLGPLLLLATTLNDRRTGRAGHGRALAEYHEQRAAAEVALRDALAGETAARRAAAPDPATVLVAARAPSSWLWHRRRHDPDALELRIGLGDLPPATSMVRGSETLPAPTTLHAVPLTVDLKRAGAVGLALGAARGPRSGVDLRGLARWWVAQAAALHSPHDLRLVLLCPRAGGEDWHWVRWLPHARPRDGSAWCRIGSDEATWVERVGELTAVLDARTEQVRRHGAAGTLDRLPLVLVVLDGARALRAVPGMARLLDEGPPLGIVFCCLDDDENLLPRECAVVVAPVPDRPGRVLVRGLDGSEGAPTIVPDVVTPAWCETLGRAVAPLRDADPELVEASLPASSRFVELAELADPLRPEALIERWRRQPRSTSVLLGVASRGAHRLELTDGPHMLVAGATGAGKSALLQTLVTSIALSNRPDEFHLILVDFKGGAAFRDCRRLPHCVGMVTDLDPGTTNRALTSLRAEVDHRKRVLDHAGLPDIVAYQAAAARGTLPPGTPPLPRLLICIDEFAQLVARQPDFLDGIVDVAAQGRSLGLHLVLATQEPAGVVTKQIKANTVLRICLRVADESSSQELIGSPAGGRLPLIPGRAFVKVGSRPPEAVQVARIDGPRPDGGGRAPAPVVAHLSWDILGLPTTTDATEDPGSDETDLSAVVDAVLAAARQLGLERQRAPWTSPLPERLPLDSLPAGATVEGVAYGLEDRPADQRQEAARLDVVGGGHVAVVGGPRSGRSTALRTMVGALATAWSPSDLHLYALDCAGGGLRALAALPHCGAVVGAADPDRVERLLAGLLTEIAGRQQRIAAAGCGDLAELHDERAEDAPAWAVLVVDGYEGFLGAFLDVDGGRMIADLQRILRDGAGAGVRVVLAGDRSMLAGRTGSLLDERLVLRMASETDYGYVGLSPHDVPADQPPGRAVRTSVSRTVQIALLDGQESGRGQAEALAGIAAAARRDHPEPDPAPLRVDPLPVSLTLGEAVALGELERGQVLIGVGGDTLAPVHLDPERDGRVLLVHGPRRSGRSNALGVAAASLLAAGRQVLIIAPRPSPLLDWAGSTDVEVVAGGAAVSALDLPTRLTGPRVIVVDDLENLPDAIAAELAATIKRADGGHVVLLAGTTDAVADALRGPAVEAGRAGLGLVLCPTAPKPGSVFGFAAPRTPRSLVGTTLSGRGVLLRGGSATAVQVPLLDTGAGREVDREPGSSFSVR